MLTTPGGGPCPLPFLFLKITIERIVHFAFLKRLLNSDSQLDRKIVFRKRKTRNEHDRKKDESSIGSGLRYLYMIIAGQVAFVLGILVVIMVIGKVISTPGWVFLAAFLLFAAALIHIYRKAKRQFRELKDTLSRLDLSDRNVEVSLMGGLLTMKIEQKPTPNLLGPPAQEAEPQLLIPDSQKKSGEHGTSR